MVPVTAGVTKGATEGVTEGVTKGVTKGVTEGYHALCAVPGPGRRERMVVDP